MKKLLCALAVSAVASPLTYAYQAEIEGNYTMGSLEFEEGPNTWDVDSDNLMLKGSWFFKDVDTEKGPLAEVAFLDKVGSASLMINRGTIENDGFKMDNDNWGLGVRGVLKEKFILEFDYIDNSLSANGVSGSFDTTNINLGFGAYLNDTTTLVVSLLTHENEFSGIKLADGTGLNGAFKTFIPLSDGQSVTVGGNLAIINSDAAFGDAEEQQINFSIYTAYYLSNDLSLRGALTSTSSEVEDGVETETLSMTTLSFGSEYFVNEQFSVYGDLGLNFGDDEQEDLFDSETTDISGTNLVVGVKGRF